MLLDKLLYTAITLPLRVILITDKGTVFHIEKPKRESRQTQLAEIQLAGW